MRTRLSTVDWAFLQAESDTNLSHVAGLWVFERPGQQRGNFWRQFLDGLREAEVAAPPFNLRLGTGLELPAWEEDPDFDLDNHVHLAALPRPGSTRQLLNLLARIHSRRLDRSIPLWQCYLIDGLAGRRVALYFKVHHALLDGVATLRYMVDSLSKSPTEKARRPFWQPPADPASSPPGGLLDRLTRMSAGLASQARSLPELSAALASEGIKALGLAGNETPAPFTAPRTRFGRSISSRRKLGFKSFSLSRIRAIGDYTGSTVNDVVLAMSAGALRRFLQQNDELPKRPLTAWVPVSLRSDSTESAGNRVSVLVSTLATDEADPGKRLQRIQDSVRSAKKQFRGRSAQTSDTFTQLLSGLVVLSQALGLADRLAPAANVIVSNVPGPRSQRYLNGARLVQQYPISMLIDGQALNITVTSHDDRLDFGLLACPEAVRDPQSLADYLELSPEELEQAAVPAGSDGSHDMSKKSPGAKQSNKSSAAGKKAPRKKASKKTVKKKALKKKTVKKAAGTKTPAPKAKTLGIGGFSELVSSLSAIPNEALRTLASGEQLGKRAAADLQNAFDRLNEATSVLKLGSADQGAAEFDGLDGPDPFLMNAQAPLWNLLMDYYFRLEIEGWDRLPEEPSLLIGIHSGGPLTMDAWTVALAWWRHFGQERKLHGTAHDVLMSAPGLGTYFKRMGTLSPSRENIAEAFKRGDDVILWPGGEVDAYRSWDKRDRAVLGGRKGFIRLAIREQVPIVPVATIGGHDTLFVLSEGRGLAKTLGLKKRLRSDVAPITFSVPFGVTLHLTPFQHVPLPAKIRTELQDPVHLDTDREKENDNDYVEEMYQEIESLIQAGMDRLAKKRKFPVFG